MPTATSKAAPPAAQPSSSQNRPPSRSSDAIQRGADLLLELFNEEQSQLTHACRENEDRFNIFKAQAEARIASSDSKSVKNMALSKKIFTQYDRSVRDLEVIRNELQHIKGEYAKLMASIEEVGLVYMNGSLHFNQTTAEIVSDFRQVLDLLISHKNPNLDMASLPPDHDADKPSDLFLFLSGYAHVLKIQQQSRNASFSKSMNDATPESEQKLAFPAISPFTSPTTSSCVPESKGVAEIKTPSLKRSLSSPALDSSPSKKPKK